VWVKPKTNGKRVAHLKLLAMERPMASGGVGESVYCAEESWEVA
jgi:hypothetical protein